ncbi:hypothetical protein ERO13_D07G159966v2 [Gossypium hirsutum]|nr:hypothetical protein ERO13_D07G159966v2 [Gossypium hirsutum]
MSFTFGICVVNDVNICLIPLLDPFLVCFYLSASLACVTNPFLCRTNIFVLCDFNYRWLKEIVPSEVEAFRSYISF